MAKDSGHALTGQALVSDQAPTGLAAPRFDPSCEDAREIQLARVIADCFSGMPERMAKAPIRCGEDVLGTLWDFSREIAREVIDALTQQEMSSDTEQTLKPCPFCGGEAERYTAVLRPGFEDRQVQCRSCGATAFDLKWQRRVIQLLSLSSPLGTQATAIPAGMKAWDGGGKAPQDWDVKPVFMRDGTVRMPPQTIRGIQFSQVAAYRQEASPLGCVASSTHPTPIQKDPAIDLL